LIPRRYDEIESALVLIASFGSATFGAITSLAANATMRQVQLGLKLLF